MKRIVEYCTCHGSPAHKRGVGDCIHSIRKSGRVNAKIFSRVNEGFVLLSEQMEDLRGEVRRMRRSLASLRSRRGELR